jgi:hypothetical protein
MGQITDDRFDAVSRLKSFHKLFDFARMVLNPLPHLDRVFRATWRSFNDNVLSINLVHVRYMVEEKTQPVNLY